MSRVISGKTVEVQWQITLQTPALNAEKIYKCLEKKYLLQYSINSCK